MSARGPKADVKKRPGKPLTHCRNCAARLTDGQAFCAHCGQKVTVDRLAVREILHDFWHSMVHVDRSALALVYSLSVRPGYVARDYVDGKRKRYFGPFAFLVIVVGLASAAIEVSGFKPTGFTALGTGTANDMAHDAAAVNAAGNFFQRHFNAVILLEVPLLAAFTRVMFRKDETNFAEDLVLASYTSGMRSLFTTVILIPGSFIVRLNGMNPLNFYVACLLIWLAYFGIAANQFSREHRLRSGLKGVLAAALTGVASQIVLSAVTMGFVLYLSRG